MNMDSDSIQMFSRLRELSEALSQLAQLAENFFTNTVSLIERWYNYISSIRAASEEVRQTLQIRRTKDDVFSAAEKAKQFLHQVGELTSLYSSRSQMMKNAQRGLERQDYRPFNDLIEQLRQGLVRAREYYREFEEACEAVIQTCTEEVEECNRKAREARNKKETTKIVGTGLTTAGAVSGGLMGSLAGGPIGFAIFMMSMIGGGGGGYFTYSQVCDLQQSQETFGNIGQQFDIMLRSTFSIKEEIRSVQTHLGNISDALDNVTLPNDTESIPSIRIALKRMSAVSKTAQQTLKTCHRQLNAKMDEFRRNVA